METQFARFVAFTGQIQHQEAERRQFFTDIDNFVPLSKSNDAQQFRSCDSCADNDNDNNRPTNRSLYPFAHAHGVITSTVRCTSVSNCAACYMQNTVQSGWPDLPRKAGRSGDICIPRLYQKSGNDQSDHSSMSNQVHSSSIQSLRLNKCRSLKHA